MMQHEKFMRAALREAAAAQAEGEVPVGAVIVKDGEIIAAGRNRRETQKTALGHAEIEAIHSACRRLGDWRLTGCTLYVTLEPCAMCCGALLAARVETVVFGAYDEIAGACVSTARLSDLPHATLPQVIGGYMEAPCRALLTETFAARRKAPPTEPHR